MRKVVGETRRRSAEETSAPGFTIIEVILFFAISSAMLVALLATVGFTISRQRFTDSGMSLQAFFQQQFNETTNVVNDRESGTCPAGGDSADTQPGQSTCVVLGLAIDMTAGSSMITTHTVVGAENDNPDGLSGKALIASYNPTITEGSASQYNISWDATVIGVKPEGNTRLLLLRSPDSGLVLHFSGTPAGSLKDLVDASDPHQTYSLCIQSGDITNVGGVAAITISPLASTESVNSVFNLSDDQRNELC